VFYRDGGKTNKGEAKVTVGTQDREQSVSYFKGLLCQVGDYIVDGQSRFDARLDRLEGKVDVLTVDVGVLKSDVSVLKSDVSVLKSDVGVLKTDVAALKTGMVETNERLGRLEESQKAGFNSFNAQFERLIAYIERDERKNP
jgi:outer membrane murein-binding lipoprotein Lpp